MTEAEWLECKDPTLMFNYLRGVPHFDEGQDGMTELEWLNCTSLEAMFRLLPGRPSDRKLWLFACACCRRVWPSLEDERSQKAVEIIESYAEFEATEEDVLRAYEDAHHALYKGDGAMAAMYAAAHPAGQFWSLVGAVEKVAYHAAHAAASTVYPDPSTAALLGSSEDLTGTEDIHTVGYIKTRQCEQAIQMTLFREVLGFPFGPARIYRSWLTWNNGVVPRVAQGIYENRAFDRLPILADALEEAGCDNADILTHCRGSGPHVRGCWVVELLLGKE